MVLVRRWCCNGICTNSCKENVKVEYEWRTPQARILQLSKHRQPRYQVLQKNRTHQHVDQSTLLFYNTNSPPAQRNLQNVHCRTLQNSRKSTNRDSLRPTSRPQAYHKGSHSAPQQKTDSQQSKSTESSATDQRINANNMVTSCGSESADSKYKKGR